MSSRRRRGPGPPSSSTERRFSAKEGRSGSGPARRPRHGLGLRTRPIIRPITWVEPHGREATGRTNNPYAAGLLGIRRTPKTAENGLQSPVQRFDSARRLHSRTCYNRRSGMVLTVTIAYRWCPLKTLEPPGSLPARAPCESIGGSLDGIHREVKRQVSGPLPRPTRRPALQVPHPEGRRRRRYLEVQLEMDRGCWLDPCRADIPLATWAEEFLSLAGTPIVATDQEAYRRDTDK
jgi:hypothetical protein